VDVEATCWDGPPPDKQFSEIIEIGLAVIDTKSLKILTSTSWIIKPTWSQVSAFCTNLTGITSNEVANGISLQQACSEIRKKYNSRDLAWCSYGDYDRKMFLSDCTKKGASYPFSDTHINTKGMFNYLLPQKMSSCGLQAAAASLGIMWEGQAHRGEVDATNLAYVMIELAKRERK
jgi:inhibitor of KinA sporulation pathway (predicted exonuclease)